MHGFAAICGVILQGLLAVLFARVWISLRQRWAFWLGLSFAVNTALCLRMLAGYYVEALDAVPQQGNAALVLTGLVLCTMGLLDYAGVPRRAAARLVTLAGTVAVLTFAGVAWGLLSRREGLAVWAAFLVGWAGLFGWTMRREPRCGHAFAMLALVSYPVAVAAVLRGNLDAGMLPAAHVVLMASLGMTVLTTGLLRSHALAAREGARARASLQAREQAERELRQANETLEMRVSLRTAELRETIEGLESFNRAISHDLRGPLGGIAGVARIARDHVASGNCLAAENLLQAIASQADATHRLVGALLALARSSDTTLQRQDVDMQALALEVTESLRQACPTQRAAVVVACLPRVEADIELVRQVFVNLIGNAIKFSANAAYPRVEVGAVVEAGVPVFYVRDNGVGFAPDEATQLFKPFRRLHGQAFEGFGVGLSIVRRIIDRHGGAVWAQANPEGGATFRFTVRAPVSRDQADSTPAMSAPRRSSLPALATGAAA